MADSILKKIGGGIDRYIGGLLGEDISSLSKEEKTKARRQAIGIISRGMLSPDAGSQALADVMTFRKEQKEAPKRALRLAEAEAMLPQVTGRLFGGAPAATMPTGGEGELTGVNVQSRYRQDPAEAMRMMIGTQPGRDIAAGMPGLMEMAKEATGPKDYVYQNVSGVGLVAVNKKDPSDVKVVQSERARATGPSERFKILSPAEAQANNLPAGMTYQQNTVTGQITPLQTGGAGGLSDTDMRQYREKMLGVQNARGQIKNLQNTLSEVPAYKAIAGEGRGRLESSYSLALSAIRELQKSGVLNMGELPFLSKALEDPTSFSSIVTSPIQRKKLKGQIDTVMTLLDQQEQNLQYQYGMPTPSMEPPPSGAGTSGGPTSRGGRRRAPSPDAANRANKYY